MVFFENFLGGAAEDHLKCKKRSGIHSDRALLLNALPVPLLRQVGFQPRLADFCFWLFGPPKQCSHAGKIHFFKKIQVFRVSRTTFYLHWSSVSSQNNAPMQVKLTFSILKSKVPTCLSFSCFSIIFGSFWRPWGLFWHPFGAFVVSFGVLVSSF